MRSGDKQAIATRHASNTQTIFNNRKMPVMFAVEFGQDPVFVEFKDHLIGIVRQPDSLIFGDFW
ncbi:MAG TPA: hypothetical protein DCZ07_11730 [Alphaproteobacteria bacterium]|nr:hypothetical protein [Alphaproteobacteria bacterium]